MLTGLDEVGHGQGGSFSSFLFCSLCANCGVRVYYSEMWLGWFEPVDDQKRSVHLQSYRWPSHSATWDIDLELL